MGCRWKAASGRARRGQARIVHLWHHNDQHEPRRSAPLTVALAMSLDSVSGSGAILRCVPVWCSSRGVCSAPAPALLSLDFRWALAASPCAPLQRPVGEPDHNETSVGGLGSSPVRSPPRLLPFTLACCPRMERAPCVQIWINPARTRGPGYTRNTCPPCRRSLKNSSHTAPGLRVRLRALHTHRSSSTATSATAPNRPRARPSPDAGERGQACGHPSARDPAPSAAEPGSCAWPRTCAWRLASGCRSDRAAPVDGIGGPKWPRRKRTTLRGT
jgi:hypothetical protein